VTDTKLVEETEFSCICIQAIDTEASNVKSLLSTQQHRWKNCSDGSAILDYKPLDAPSLSAAKDIRDASTSRSTDKSIN